MSIYDNVGSSYDTSRSAVGLKDILEQINILGKCINVLDLGCGTGHPVAISVAPIVKRYLGIDNSQPMLDAYLENVSNPECMLLDISEIHEVSGMWNLVLSWGALCHLPIELQKQTLVSVSKIIAPGSRLLFTGGEEPGECTGSVGLYRVHHFSMGKSGYINLLEQHGMEILSASFREKDYFVYLFEKSPN